MDNLSNDNLDDLFREGSEQAEFSFREDAWDAMDGMLEEQDKRRRAGWIILFGALFVVFSIATVWQLSQNDSNGENLVSQAIKESILQKENTITQQSMTNEQVHTPEVPSSVRTTDTSLSGEKTVDVTFEPVFEQNAIAGISKVKESINTPYQSEIDNNNPKKQKIIAAEESFVVSKPTDTEENILKEDKNSGEELIDNSQKNNLVKTNAITNEDKIQEANKEPQLALNEIAEKEKNAENTPEKGDKKLTFSFFAAPELNGAKSIGLDAKFGLRLGFRFDYGLSEKWTVGTGLAFGRRTYETGGENYTAKPGFWVEGVAPTTVEANMRITEIPLELRYYTNGKNENGFFLGVGVNSYLFSREEYRFNYDDLRDGAITSWREDWTNLDFLGLSTFTAGYQRKFANDLKLRLAPYYHLPLKGLGQGAMEMHTAGIQVEIGFR